MWPHLSTLFGNRGQLGHRTMQRSCISGLYYFETFCCISNAFGFLRLYLKAGAGFTDSVSKMRFRGPLRPILYLFFAGRILVFFVFFAGRKILNCYFFAGCIFCTFCCVCLLYFCMFLYAGMFAFSYFVRCYFFRGSYFCIFCCCILSFSAVFAGRIFSLSKRYTSFQPRTANRQSPQANLYNQRNVARLPDNHERLLQKPRAPASHPTHINALQKAISVNIACSFSFFEGLDNPTLGAPGGRMYALARLGLLHGRRCALRGRRSTWSTPGLPPTNCHQPAATNQLQPTNCDQPVVINQLSSTICHQPHELPPTNCHQPAVINQLPPTNCDQLSPTNCHPPVAANQLLPTIKLSPTNCHQPIATNQLSPTSWYKPLVVNKLPPTNCHQQTAANQLPPTDCHQPIATNQLPPTNCHQPIATTIVCSCVQ